MTAAALLLLDLLASALPQVAAQPNGDMAVRDRTRSADMVDEWRDGAQAQKKISRRRVRSKSCQHSYENCNWDMHKTKANQA